MFSVSGIYGNPYEGGTTMSKVNRKFVLGMLALGSMAIGATAALADDVKIKARGQGDNGDGSSFVVNNKVELNTESDQTESKFKIRKALPNTEITVCYSTDSCTFQFTVTTNRKGRAKVQLKTENGSFPPPSELMIAVGDGLIVNGQTVATFRKRRG